MLTADPAGDFVATSDRPGPTIMVFGNSFTRNYFVRMALQHAGRVIWLEHHKCSFDWKAIDRFHPDEVWWMPNERFLICDPGAGPTNFAGIDVEQEEIKFRRVRSLLVLGGARSGKSAYAQSLAEAFGPERLYLATAEAGDEEMAARIARHRADRGQGWATLEEPLEVARALGAEARPGRVVVVDCLTLWLSNLMLAGREPGAAIAGLAEAIGALAGPAILVSNEVGMGIVPDHKLGREFRDWQGRANREIAQACDAAVFIAAGLPVQLKPAPALSVRLG